MRNPVKIAILVLAFYFSTFQGGFSMALAGTDFYEVSVESIEGKALHLSDFKGKVLLIVNTASECGYTPQYQGLEKLYETLSPKGLVVLGMPCNQFGGQEPGSDPEIRKFCELRYGVHFPLLKKADVKGPYQHPLYRYLLSQSEDKSDIHWNFEKFLIGKTGKLLGRFKSNVEPNDPTLVALIQKALNQN